MARVVWTTRAADELAAISDYIGLDSERYASLVAQRIVTAVKSLSEFPESGSIVTEFQNPEIRERIVHRYRIIYRLQQETIVVVAIIHGARLLTDLLDF